MIIEVLFGDVGCTNGSCVKEDFTDGQAYILVEKNDSLTMNRTVEESRGHTAKIMRDIFSQLSELVVLSLHRSNVSEIMVHVFVIHVHMGELVAGARSRSMMAGRFGRGSLLLLQHVDEGCTSLVANPFTVLVLAELLRAGTVEHLRQTSERLAVHRSIGRTLL